MDQDGGNSRRAPGRTEVSGRGRRRRQATKVLDPSAGQPGKGDSAWDGMVIYGDFVVPEAAWHADPGVLGGDPADQRVRWCVAECAGVGECV